MLAKPQCMQLWRERERECVCVCVCAHTMCESCLTDYCVKHLCSRDAVFWPGMLCIFFRQRSRGPESSNVSNVYVCLLTDISATSRKKKVVDKTAGKTVQRKRELRLALGFRTESASEHVRVPAQRDHDKYTFEVVSQ